MEDGGTSALDPNSYANPEHAKLDHFDIDWKINFEKKVLSGSIVLHFSIIDATIDQLTLDSRDLNLSKVICEENGQSLKFHIDEAHPHFGSKISITLPSDQLKKISIRIFYSTSSSATGLQWLNPNQTSGKVHPFLFSQCQPIHARSLIPCQDTPSVKATYKAVVKCDSNIVVLMSALRCEQKDTIVDASDVAYHFHQPVAIPSYLLAVVAGDLVCKDIGPRSKVWSEKDVIDKAAYEFAETEKMLSTAESLFGKYIWQQYDLLVLPPSFPYGGMENPCLTFVTPTLLAGDRSLADVVAHEICHSWTGNLVTNTNWEHFWLNEGFTVFFERKIVSRLHGEPSRNLSAIQGWHDLQFCIDSKEVNDPLTCLVTNLKECDPDEAYSSVPYEKGHAFLWYLEGIVGGADEFEPFLKAYVDKFKRKSINTDTFKNFLLEYFSNKSNELKVVDWKAWLYTPGMPPFHPEYDTSLADACYDLYQRWKDWDSSTDCPFSSKDLEKFSTQQKLVWLDKLLEDPLSLEKVKKIDEKYAINTLINSEIKFRWLRLCILARWEEQVEEALDFVNKQGRLKFVRPIYRDIYAWEAVREKAISNFLSNKDAMMHVSVSVLNKDLHLQDK